MANIVDLPGTYSLISRSPDEQVAMEVLRGMRSDSAPPDVVITLWLTPAICNGIYILSAS